MGIFKNKRRIWKIEIVRILIVIREILEIVWDFYQLAGKIKILEILIC